MKRLIKRQSGGSNPDNELMEMFEAFAQSADDDDFKSGQDVYNEFIKLNPEQQKQFISNIQQYAPQDEISEMQVGGNPKRKKDSNIFNDIYNTVIPNKNAGFLEKLDGVMSAPARGVTKLITGKYQDPSDALGIDEKEHPYLKLATDMVLDPTNLLGIGLAGKASKLARGSKLLRNTDTVLATLSDGSKTIARVNESIRAANKIKKLNTVGKTEKIGDYIFKTLPKLDIDVAIHNAVKLSKKDAIGALSIINDLINQHPKQKEELLKTKTQIISNNQNPKETKTQIIKNVNKSQYPTQNRTIRKSLFKTPNTNQIITNEDINLNSITPEENIQQNYINTPQKTLSQNTNVNISGELKNEYDVNPRSKNTVPYQATNNGKQWTPEEYSKYIDEQKLKTSKYNQDIRNGIIKQQTGGIPTNENGYYELNPYENPIAKIPSNKITMKGLKYNIRAVGGSGKDYGEMLPDQEYSFPDEEYMYEIPKMQSGGNSWLNNYKTKNKVELNELNTLKSNKSAGYLTGEQSKRLLELENKHKAFNKALKRSDNKTLNDLTRESKQNVSEKFNVNKKFEEAKKLEKLEKQKAFQKSLEKVVPKNKIDTEESARILREENKRIERALDRKIPKDNSLAERIKNRGTYNYEDDLTRIADEAYENAYKPISKTQRLIKGAGKVLNSPITKSLGRGLSIIDMINTGLNAKSAYDNGEVESMIDNDKTPLGKKYQDLMSVKNRFNKGVSSFQGFLDVSDIEGYYKQLGQQYLAEKQGKVKHQQKPASLNQNYKLVNDLSNAKSKELNVPFAKPIVTTTSNVSDNLPVTPETVQQVKDNNQPFVQSKKPPLVKKKSVTSNVKGNPNVDEEIVRTNQDFANSLQPLKPKGIPITNLSKVNNEDKLKQWVKTNKEGLDLPFAQSKPITMEFGNPYEANAIAYKKLKNASVMSPYKGSVNLQTPELYQESITPYVNNIREQRNAVLQQLNPNSTSGQSVLANIYGQGIAQENEAVSNVGRSNAKFTTDWLAQKAETRNRQQQLDYDMNNKYSADVAQLQATQDENDINYMNSISEMNAKRLQAKNALVRTAMETGMGDALDIKDNSFTFDVNKLPKNFYSKDVAPVDGKKRELGKIINVKGIPYESYLDENGKPVMRKVEMQQVGGKTNKYKINLANKAY